MCEFKYRSFKYQQPKVLVEILDSGIKFLIIFIVVIVIYAPVSVIASDCFKPSLSMTRQIDVYEPLQPTELSSDQYNQVQVLFKKMVGEWVGLTRTVSCKGDADSIKEVVSEYGAEVDVEKNDTSIEIESHMHSSEQKKSFNTSLKLFLSPKRLGVTEVSRAGDLEILSLSKQFLVFYRKFIRRTVAGGAIATEAVRSFALSDRQFLMEYSEYTNGLLSEKILWELKKK